MASLTTHVHVCLACIYHVQVEAERQQSKAAARQDPEDAQPRQWAPLGSETPALAQTIALD
jgi:hypothetical protein